MRLKLGLLLAVLLVAALTVLSACGGGGGGGGTPSQINATYKVTYNGNGSTGGSVPFDSTNYQQGQTVTVLGNTGILTYPGCSFTGWNTKTDGTGTTYTQGQTFAMGAADVTLYAVWTANPTYKVTYNGNGSTSGSVPIDFTNYQPGQTVTVLGNTGNLVNTGYTFANWNTKADGSGTSYMQGQTFTMGSADVILYAIWSSSPTYSISGTVTSSGTALQGVTITLNSAITATTDASGNYTFSGLANGNYIITPSKNGYTFSPTSSAQTVNNANIYAVNFTGINPLTQGLVAYYPFNGDANDASGYGNNGIVSGATLTTDRFGNANRAYAFNGTNNYIKINTQNLKLSSRSVAMWIKTNQTTPAMYIAYENGSAAYGWDLYSSTYALQSALVNSTGGNSDSALQIPYGQGIQNASTGNSATASSASVITDNNWNFVVGTDDGVSLKLYINGSLISSDVSTNPVWSANMSLYMGASSPENTPNMWFNGALDDVRIYNRALSATEIQQLYNEGGYIRPLSWDITADFSLTNNPNGQWSYGRKWSPGDSSIDLFNLIYNGYSWWFGNYGNGAPSILKWYLTTSAWIDMWAKDNSNGYPVVRWTCPKSGFYNLAGAFIGDDYRGIGNTIYVVINGTTTFTANLQSNLDKSNFSLDRTYFNTGDHVDFINVWNGGVYSEYGVVGVSARITEAQ